MLRWWILALSLLGLALAQDWRLYESRSHTEAGPGPWRYTLSPRTKEAQELWRRLSEQYRDHLRAGYRVDLGGWRVYFRGGALWLASHCPKADNPACFTFGVLPVEKARQDRFLLELGALLEEGLGRVRATGGSLTLSRLFRVEVARGASPPYRAAPSGWRP
ncbi:hypothetical protein TTMY_0718 [Thermus thermophilus]|uniref:hypothetical protein n=1 Tax=Thermus thermophilus TaxID=274 RepID=UPI00090BF5BD|nr:hypothetical protein [Thermus thermophilus]BAW01127.1 hypothetical protein TTMY_0718 [Thermus thermophilus]BDB11795.1 hypothetical protein TthTMY_15340 [Thermus thermophilus]